jgi:tRNA-dihydrouridine synthase 3
VKVRKGWSSPTENAKELLPMFRRAGMAAVSVHGRTRQQRYTRGADWSYLYDCARSARRGAFVTPTSATVTTTTAAAAAAAASGMQFVGGGDVYTYSDYYRHLAAANGACDGSCGGDAQCEGECADARDSGGRPLATCMLARGALVKPWLFQEIKERRHIDISAGERLELIKSFCNFGLEHWGSDTRGVESTRRYLVRFFRAWLACLLYRFFIVSLIRSSFACHSLSIAQLSHVESKLSTIHNSWSGCLF